MWLQLGPRPHQTLRLVPHRPVALTVAGATNIPRITFPLLSTRAFPDSPHVPYRQLLYLYSAHRFHHPASFLFSMLHLIISFSSFQE